MLLERPQSFIGPSFEALDRSAMTALCLKPNATYWCAVPVLSFLFNHMCGTKLCLLSNSGIDSNTRLLHESLLDHNLVDRRLNRAPNLRVRGSALDRDRLPRSRLPRDGLKVRDRGSRFRGTRFSGGVLRRKVGASAPVPGLAAPFSQVTAWLSSSHVERSCATCRGIRRIRGGAEATEPCLRMGLPNLRRHGFPVDQ